MTSPTAPGSDALPADFEYVSLVEEEAPSSMESAPTATEDAPPDDGAAPPPAPEALAETTADAAADTPEAPPAPDAPPGSQSQDIPAVPEGGQPFSFTVDGGRSFSPEGALQFPDGSVLLPAKAWNQVRGGFLVDRESVNGKLAAYRQQAQQAQQSATQAVQEQVEGLTLERDQARAALGEFQRILAQGPEALVRWVEQFEVNRPILEARMREVALEAKLAQVEKQREQWRGREQQEDQARQAEVLRPQLEAHLDTALDHYLGGDYAGVAKSQAERAELRQFLWDTMRGSLFYEDEQGIGFRTDVLEAVLKKEKARLGEQAKQIAELQAAAKRNAAALQPTGQPKTPPARPAAKPEAKAPLDVDEVIDRRKYVEFT